MDEFFAHAWEDLVGRVDGPMKLRLIIQPLVAVILAVRAGLRDIHEDRPPLFWALAFHPEQRRDLLRQAWKDAGKVRVWQAEKRKQAKLPEFLAGGPRPVL